MLYAVVLFLHSWLRWVVLLAAAALLARSARLDRPWESIDRRLGLAFVAGLDTQVLLGLVLYVVSPLTPGSFAALGEQMHVHALRFFAVEHGFAMIVALAVAHVAWARARRAADDRARRRVLRIGVGVALAVILLAIPWPWLSYGRPLLRIP